MRSNNRINHFTIGDARRENAPQPCGPRGGSLVEGFYSDCACRGHWYRGHWASTPFGAPWFGWSYSIAHSSDCKKANA